MLTDRSRSPLFPAALLAALALAAPAPSAADTVGVRTLAIPAPERGQPLTVTLWYPAGPGGTPEVVGENRVFAGVPARRDAELAAGRFRLVLLAHGGLRAAPNQAGWIASDLASRGAIVAVVVPPKPADAAAAVAETWLRAGDLSAVLTALAADPVSAHTLPGPTAVVGFFLGGTAGLTLAGFRLDPERYARSCDPPAQGPDCAWFAAAGVDLHAVDSGRLRRGGKDARFGTVVAIDPELTSALSPDSLDGTAAKVTVIGLGDHPDASGLTGRLPDLAYARLPDATPFSAMAACKPAGAAVLAAEGADDSICREDQASRDRAHARLADMIAGYLGLR